MASRTVGGSSYTLTYDQENRLTGVSGAVSAAFVYDGDGRRVKATVAGVTTTYIGDYFEWAGSTMTKYYRAGATRIAMRKGATLYWLLGDHLGSTSKVFAASGTTQQSEQRYMPWGENRHTSGSLPTKRKFTGQIEESALGLYFYNARWYDPYLTQFTQPDSIIPDPSNPLDWNRYSYARYNPLKYVDPTGHYAGPPPVCPYGCTIWDYSNVGGSGVGGRLLRALISTGTELVDLLLTNGATQTDPQACTWNLAGAEDRFIAGTIPPTLLGVSGGRQLPLPGFEDILQTQVPGKLSDATKNAFRREARGIFYNAYPRLSGRGLEVHHRIPLEWVHLFPEADPNRLSNLIGLDPSIHDGIDLRWNGFRSHYNRLGRSPTAQEILEFATSIDKKFSQYYNKLLEKKKR